jgi:hypothetical protein
MEEQGSLRDWTKPCVRRLDNTGVNLIKAQYIHVWKTKVNPCETINIHLKGEGQEGKTGPV